VYVNMFMHMDVHVHKDVCMWAGKEVGWELNLKVGQERK